MAEINLAFNDFLKAANDALVHNPSGEKSVIQVGLDTENDTYTVGTQKWQTLGSRSDDYKKDNRDARTKLLAVLMEKYGTSQADRLPKAVLDALNLSDFGLDKEGQVTSQRPLTARRIIAINQAMERLDKGEDTGLLDELAQVQNNIPDKLTSNNDQHWKQLLEIGGLSDKAVKGKTLLLAGVDDHYRYIVGTEDSLGDILMGAEQIDSRHGARKALYRDLMAAGGGLDPDFVKEAFVALKLDSHNPVYEDLPLKVAKDLIVKVCEIRASNPGRIAEEEVEEAVEVIKPTKMGVAEYEKLCKTNLVFLKDHLGEVVEQLELDKNALEVKEIVVNEDAGPDEKALDDDGKIRARNKQSWFSKLSALIDDLKKDLKGAGEKSPAYMAIAKVLVDKNYAGAFREGHSDKVREEFLVYAAQGRVEEYCSHNRLAPNGWTAEDAHWNVDYSPDHYPIELPDNATDPMDNPKWVDGLIAEIDSGIVV